MKLFAVLLLIAGSVMAFAITPDYLGIHDTGSKSLPTMDIEISIDCNNKDLTVTVMEGGGAIQNAETTLFYTDYGYQPLPNRGKTDSEGKVTMNVPGTLNFLTGLFILRVDRQGYQSREIEFAYEKCFEEPPLETVVYEGTMDIGEQTGGIQEPVEIPEPEATYEPEESIAPAEENEAASLPGEVVREETIPAEQSFCPLAMIMLSLLMIKAKL
ncbi:hypothetical protein JXA56_05790 [Candidatus Micrarchaeota archaeon]|nr:hypothetical protein [Candidatus Micrarchaeota archaeon]